MTAVSVIQQGFRHNFAILLTVAFIWLSTCQEIDNVYPRHSNGQVMNGIAMQK